MSSETELDAEGLDAHRREVSRLTAENKLLRAAADPAKVGAVGDLVKHATRLVQIERDDARAERDTLSAAIAEVRRLCDMTIATSCRAQAIDQAVDTLAVLDRVLGTPEATTEETNDEH